MKHERDIEISKAVIATFEELYLKKLCPWATLHDLKGSDALNMAAILTLAHVAAILTLAHVLIARDTKP